jgi:hypothetical protein
LVGGGLWYSPAVFGKAWMRENGFTEESLKRQQGDENLCQPVVGKACLASTAFCLYAYI